MTNLIEPTPDAQKPTGDQPSATNELAGVIVRNVRTLAEVRHRQEMARSTSERVADLITRFAGSMWSVYLHLAFYGGWLVINVGGIPAIKPWDPLLVQLAMVASVEAMFLSTFILITQNRMQHLADQRAELDLQINLLSEHEITRLIRMLERVANKLQVDLDPDEPLDEVKTDVSPVDVAAVIDETRSRQSQQDAN